VERADVPANDYTRAIDPEFKGEACIVCMYCGASVCGHDYMEALGRWNHRAKEPMTGGKLACECNGAEAGFSYGDLVDWYINSVSPDDKPVWTEGHIEELMKDFILFPRTGATA
jgi:environmental stress-induced protein Ves